MVDVTMAQKILDQGYQAAKSLGDRILKVQLKDEADNEEEKEGFMMQGGSRKIWSLLRPR